MGSLDHGRKALLTELTEVLGSTSGAADESSVELLGVRDRAQSVLYDVRLVAGPNCQQLVVKQPKVPSEIQRGPRLFDPVADPRHKAWLEFRALKAIENNTAQMRDPLLGAVGVHGFLPQAGATVMARVAAPLLLSSLTGPQADLPTSDVLATSGRWLRQFHSIQLKDTTDLDSSRADFLDGLATLLPLQGGTRSPSLTPLSNARRELLMAMAGELFDGMEPRGLLHGDFAPRNVFVSETGKVSVIDSLGRFRAPILDDIAHFLVALELNLDRRILRADLQMYRASFLAGYGQPDTPLLWVFEVRSLISKWHALSGRLCTHQGGLRGRTLRFRRLMTKRKIEQRLKRIRSGMVLA
jgi:hypothetical protein